MQFVYSYFSKQCELLNFWNGTCRAKLEVCSRFVFIAIYSDLYLSIVPTLPRVAWLILGQCCIYDEHRSLHTKCRGNFRGYRRPLRATLSCKIRWREIKYNHDNDVTMGAIASLITSLTIVYSTVYSDTDQRKHQSSASLAFVRGSHRGPVNSPHKLPVTQKMFPFGDVITNRLNQCSKQCINGTLWNYRN